MKEERTIEAIDNEIEEYKKKLANVKGRETEVYTRIVGYYRSVKNWNKGKKAEFKQRVCFQPDFPKQDKKEETAPASFISFIKKTCPNCPAVKNYVADITLPNSVYDVDTEEGFKKASENNVFAVPTVIFFNNSKKELFRAYNVKDIREKLPETLKAAAV